MGLQSNQRKIISFKKMKIEEARQLGERIAQAVHRGKMADADDLLAAVLAERTPFRLLDAIGAQFGKLTIDKSDIFLDQVAAGRTIGGWIIIASALRQQLPVDLQGVIGRCQKFIVLADAWYAADAFGERVVGQALVDLFEPSLPLLEPWCEDRNPWIRRTVGVAVHFWAKRAHGNQAYAVYVQKLLTFLEPLFSESDIIAVKGVGWGLKTLGRYYPQAVTEWLMDQRRRPHKALMLRKAMTYLTEENRVKLSGAKS